MRIASVFVNKNSTNCGLPMRTSTRLLKVRLYPSQIFPPYYPPTAGKYKMPLVEEKKPSSEDYMSSDTNLNMELFQLMMTYQERLQKKTWEWYRRMAHRGLGMCLVFTSSITFNRGFTKLNSRVHHRVYEEKSGVKSRYKSALNVVSI